MTTTVSLEMLEHGMVLHIIYQTLCGMEVAVVMVMAVVLKLECHGSIGNYK